MSRLATYSGAVLFSLLGMVVAQRSSVCTPIAGNLHDFSADLLDESGTVNFADYDGKFSYQEPGANATEIYNILMNVRPGGGFVPNFPLFKKIEVNGPNAEPLYEYLRGSCPAPMPEYREKLRLTYDPLHANDVRWNFEKFLVDQNGLPYMRFEPTTLPEELVVHIEELIAGKEKPKMSKDKAKKTSPLRQL